MKQLETEELSALLDGELSAEHAMHVHARIAADPALRAEYDELLRLDASMRQVAEAQAFIPEIRLPTSAIGIRRVQHWVAAALLIAMLLVARCLPKFVDPAGPGVAIQLAAAAIMLIALVRLAKSPWSLITIGMPQGQAA